MTFFAERKRCLCWWACTVGGVISVKTHTHTTRKKISGWYLLQAHTLEQSPELRSAVVFAEEWRHSDHDEIGHWYSSPCDTWSPSPPSKLKLCSWSSLWVVFSSLKKSVMQVVHVLFSSCWMRTSRSLEAKWGKRNFCCEWLIWSSSRSS